MSKSNVIALTKEDIGGSSILNALMSTLRQRLGAALYGESPDGKRDYNALFGYPVNPSYAYYRNMYNRGGIAHTVVAKMAKACWRDVPEIKVDDKEVEGDLIADLKKAGLFKALERADILNRIGKIAILFIGVQDGEDLDKPIGNGGDIEDLYFNVYGEDGIEVVTWDEDPTSKRFQLPVVYQLMTTTLESGSSKSQRFEAVKVHFSRLVLLAEGALENPIEGVSALEPVLNALLDKDKIRGGSGESHFRNARQKFALTANKDAAFSKSTSAKDDLADEVEAFTNNQKDYVRLKNMEMKVMQPQLADPRASNDICVEEVSGQTGIAIRILSGKGGGQTTGAEDKASWNALVHDRQESDCTGWFVNSLDILAESKVIKELPDSFVIVWPEQSALSEKENSEVNNNKASTLQQLAAARSVPGGDEIDMESALKALDLEDIDIDDTVPTGGLEDEL